MSRRDANGASPSVPLPVKEAALSAPTAGQKRSVSTPELEWNERKRVMRLADCACNGLAPMLSSKGRPTVAPATPRRKVRRDRKRALRMATVPWEEGG